MRMVGGDHHVLLANYFDHITDQIFFYVHRDKTLPDGRIGLPLAEVNLI